jgi:hypothetical protein
MKPPLASTTEPFSAAPSIEQQKAIAAVPPVEQPPHELR